ncbi:DUF952 domain-containing protein [Microseira sp. BLCC-F43]|jgi:uncharacterized protein (DUF952 family)|uniref:DUF952 domain-containing protein n=1 Tax=Microseira sp. BLCC-F43 TaxID=3153602 RepID=UPI0035B82644
MLLHITKREQWEQAKQAGIYRGDTLDTEGFIHCSTPQQIIRTANRFFHNQKGLVLLCIEPEQVKAEIKYEAVDNDVFPHIYGALNIDAVTQVLDFEPEEDGKFKIPQGITISH